jgi:hypothetical protein
VCRLQNVAKAEGREGGEAGPSRERRSPGEADYWGDRWSLGPPGFARMPGHLHFPMRIGHDLQALLQGDRVAGPGKTARTTSAPAAFLP